MTKSLSEKQYVCGCVDIRLLRCLCEDVCVFHSEVMDTAAEERSHGALAFRFNDHRSLLPLLPGIAF